MGSSAEPSEGVATHKTGSGYFTRSEVFECSYRRNDPSRIDARPDLRGFVRA